MTFTPQTLARESFGRFHERDASLTLAVGEEPLPGMISNITHGPGAPWLAFHCDDLAYDPETGEPLDMVVEIALTGPAAQPWHSLSIR